MVLYFEEVKELMVIILHNMSIYNMASTGRNGKHLQQIFSTMILQE